MALASDANLIIPYFPVEETILFFIALGTLVWIALSNAWNSLRTYLPEILCPLFPFDKIIIPTPANIASSPVIFPSSILFTNISSYCI
ncbi:hypothetical protein [Apibacter adventoris]|uniref:Uncharacterized protein n=1 Tax=Apibacter adventoris TaxID=1679466 RepID=A0A2S8A4I3_9FLAO|nr:hypothetical protein [Apibacter adventoris]PQL89474.1 hypothetical protein C4S77_12595 [Apibacter adventoris]